jgi:orotate phosphoribosyltransferase
VGAFISAAQALRTDGAIVSDAMCAISWNAEVTRVLAASDLILRPVLTLEDLRIAWTVRR